MILQPQARKRKGKQASLAITRGQNKEVPRHLAGRRTLLEGFSSKYAHRALDTRAARQVLGHTGDNNTGTEQERSLQLQRGLIVQKVLP